MKSHYWFTLGMLLFLGVMYLVESNLPKKFVWHPTFSQHDFQPFGCALFDSLVRDAWQEGYYVNDWSLYQMERDSTEGPVSLLVIAENLKLTETDRNALLRMVQEGNRIMLVSNSFSLEDTLNYQTSYSYSWSILKRLKENALSENRRDTLIVTNGDVKRYCFYPQLCEGYFIRYDSTYTPLAVMRVDTLRMQNDSLPHHFPPVAICCSMGDGELMLVTNPLLFTNYGVLDGGNAAYLFRLLDELKGLPLYRLETYSNQEGSGSQSPFRYFLSQPPLRWGLYLSMITLALFMIFTARRRQRAIPVVRKTDNKTLEFVKFIGTLYFQKKGHADLIRKKFVYFAESLRHDIQVDVEDDSDDEALCRKIAGKTGMDENRIDRLLRELRPIIREERGVRESELKELIDEMNEIVMYTK